MRMEDFVTTADLLIDLSEGQKKTETEIRCFAAFSTYGNWCLFFF